MESSIMMWGTIVIFNLAILQLLRVTLAQADFRQAMTEKAPSRATETTTRTMQALPAAAATLAPVPAPVVPAGPGVGAVPAVPAAAVAPVVTDQTITPLASPSETSYSRVAGMIGAVVLACFVWAVGNVALYKMFANPEEVATLLGSLGTYFLAGASLFAPYAVNQLSTTFKG